MYTTKSVVAALAAVALCAAASAQVLDDYPLALIKEKAQGTVGFHLDYDATGTPTTCTVTASSGFRDLDAETCKRMVQRAHFKPHLDAEGSAAPGSYDGSMKWVLPH